VLANRVGSERHADMLRAGLRDPQTGWARWRVSHHAGRGPRLLPERHLGLVAAHELGDALQRLDAAADALAATPLGQMSAADLQRWAVDFPRPAPPSPCRALLAGRTVAVARDAAFSFIYAANLQTLQELGARLCFFSPLAGDRLAALRRRVAARRLPRTARRAHRRQHRPARRPAAPPGRGQTLWAECGGMVALCESVQLPDGTVQPLWGLLPGQATLNKRLAGAGATAVARGG
jgi:cobyrinic acid a,c-diamide synthase